MLTLDEFGADSVRLFLLSSPATVADEVRFSIEGVKESTRRVLLPLWNAYSFFATYASLENFDPEKEKTHIPSDLDIWIQLRLNQLIRTVDISMNSYEIAKVSPALVEFLDDLNNWYIRRSRRRFWDGDKNAFVTLYNVLLKTTQILAPFAPFAAEYFFSKLSLTKELKDMESVHLSLLPYAEELTVNEKQRLNEVDIARRVVELGRTIRVTHKIKNRQPLSILTVGVLSEEMASQIIKMKEVICQELNVKDVNVTRDPSSLAKIFVKPNFKVLGKSLGDKIKTLQQALLGMSQELALKALKKESIEVDGMILSPEQILVELRPSGNNLVASDSEIVAALNPEITEELKMEGIARELISLIQKARKTANFNVEDRILMSMECSAQLKIAIEKNKLEIEEETLSSLELSELLNADYSCQLDCEGEKVNLSLKVKL